MRGPDRPRDLVDGPAAALFLSATGTPVTAAQIRKWAQRRPELRRGRDWRGRTLYSLADLEVRARARHADVSRETRE